MANAESWPRLVAAAGADRGTPTCPSLLLRSPGAAMSSRATLAKVPGGAGTSTGYVRGVPTAQSRNWIDTQPACDPVVT
jgi:hypothetical protein